MWLFLNLCGCRMNSGEGAEMVEKAKEEVKEAKAEVKAAQEKVEKAKAEVEVAEKKFQESQTNDDTTTARRLLASALEDLEISQNDVKAAQRCRDIVILNLEQLQNQGLSFLSSFAADKARWHPCCT
jgi:thymidine kinase